jgi:hypothetical protein
VLTDLFVSKKITADTNILAPVVLAMPLATDSARFLVVTLGLEGGITQVSFVV